MDHRSGTRHLLSKHCWRYAALFLCAAPCELPVCEPHIHPEENDAASMPLPFELPICLDAPNPLLMILWNWTLNWEISLGSGEQGSTWAAWA